MFRTPIGDHDADILMAETGLCKKPIRRTAKIIMVDGKPYPSIVLAAMVIGMSPGALRKALINGESIPGHEVKYGRES